jgi:hypothetical protein
MFQKIYFKVACFAVITALMAMTSATAQSRSGAHISKQVQVMKNMLDSYVASQTALNAAQDSQINTLTSEINSMNACSANSMVYAPGNPSSDADGCFRMSTGSITQGRITRPVDYTPYSGSIVFDQPFATPPTINTSITGYTGAGPCRGYNVNFSMSISNVTTTGFDFTMPGYYSGCGWMSVHDALWFASEDVVQVSGPVTCPITTHDGVSFPTAVVGRTHSANVGRSGLSCRSRSGYTASYTGDTVSGTCLARSSDSAAWGSFSRTAQCSYTTDR